MARGNAIRILRQVTVATLAAAFIGGTLLGNARVAAWEEPLWITVYPAIAGQQAATADFVDRLTAEDFEPIAAFVAREAQRYGLPLDRPLRIELGDATAVPPAPPAGAGPLGIAWWSLRLRYWAWRQLSGRNGPAPDIRLFSVFHDPVDGVALPHSLGLEKARIGIAHVFASRRMQGSNRVVIAHELLHTLGATDKYGPDNLPRYPDGYAEPARRPLYPQRYAEIMGGRIPVSAERADIPGSLQQARIGPITAQEINWPVADGSS